MVTGSPLLEITGGSIVKGVDPTLLPIRGNAEIVCCALVNAMTGGHSIVPDGLVNDDLSLDQKLIARSEVVIIPLGDGTTFSILVYIITGRFGAAAVD
jgi:hypothetical protein